MKPLIEVVEIETVKRVYSCELDYDRFIAWLDGEEPTEEMLESYIYDELLAESPYQEDSIENSLKISDNLSKFLKK